MSVVDLCRRAALAISDAVRAGAAAGAGGGAVGLTLLVADNTTGYFGVHHLPGYPKPYKANVWRGGKDVHLGSFATAEEAALCIARSPEGRKAAERVASAAAPLMSEEEGQGSPPGRSEGRPKRQRDT